MFITYLEHGQQFAAHAASASLLGLVSLAVFAVVFARQARTRSWPATLVIGWLACLACDLLLSMTSLPAPAGLGLAMAATAPATKAASALTQPGAPRALRPPAWDLPARAAVTAALVLALTTAAAHLGPDLTGVLAPFPIGTSVVATFALAQGGAPAAHATLAGVLRGLWGFAAFCFLVAVLAVPVGGPAAFAAATLGALGVQLTVRRIHHVRDRTTTPVPLPATEPALNSGG
ncbi:hypothetical protein [Streptacidiphilus fuscans]|uniref:hypothetical protein n=1 Tax=Streptacidiphilus fuscans TaxID=2789292 RepID=UPI001C07373E|nr:hypothetical protein [Streptacidiphilus fuscans]